MCYNTKTQTFSRTKQSQWIYSLKKKKGIQRSVVGRVGWMGGLGHRMDSECPQPGSARNSAPAQQVGGPGLEIEEWAYSWHTRSTQWPLGPWLYCIPQMPVAARFSKKKKCLWERRHLPQTGKKIKANPLVRTADPFNNNNNNIAFFSQTNWDRLEMKPERNKFKVQAHW